MGSGRQRKRGKERMEGRQGDRKEGREEGGSFICVCRELRSNFFDDGLDDLVL